MAEPSELIVQRQVDAYNAHDIDGFVATYQRDAVYIRLLDGEIVYAGIDAIRRAFGELFVNNPRLHVDITNRMVLGRVVVDREEVTGREGQPTGHVIALYEVDGGLIRRVWTTRG